MFININKAGRKLYNENYSDDGKPWTNKQILVSRLLEVKDAVSNQDDLVETLDVVITMIEKGKHK